MVLGDGELVTASRTAHEALYHAVPGLCGSLGIPTAARLRLEPAYPFVKLAYYRVGSFAEAVARLSELCLEGGDGGVDFVDAIMFSADRGAFWTGKQAFVVTGVPFTRATRFMLNAFLNTEALYTALHGSNLSYRYLVQDICLPRQRAGELLRWVSSRLRIMPLWLWPVRPDERSLFSPACLTTDLVIDVGVWGVPVDLRTLPLPRDPQAVPR